MRALGIDPSLASCGFAVVDVVGGEVRPVIVKHATPPDGPQRQAWMREMVRGVAIEFAVDIVGVERSVWARHFAAMDLLASLRHAVEEACAIMGVLCVQVSPNTLKKRATGSGRASKVEVWNAARALVAGSLSEDEADALWIAVVAAEGAREGGDEEA